MNIPANIKYDNQHYSDFGKARMNGKGRVEIYYYVQDLKNMKINRMTTQELIDRHRSLCNDFDIPVKARLPFYAVVERMENIFNYKIVKGK